MKIERACWVATVTVLPATDTQETRLKVDCDNGSVVRVLPWKSGLSGAMNAKHAFFQAVQYTKYNELAWVYTALGRGAVYTFLGY